MNSEFTPQQVGRVESNWGCLVSVAAVIMVFAILCAITGYLLLAQLNGLGQEPVVDNKEDSQAEASRPGVNGSDELRAMLKSKNRLRQLMIAMFVHLDENRSFPPPRTAKFDKAGRPLLSWRVYLLPQLEQEAIYHLFHLDEPWDSEHNRKLLDKMPDVYRTRGIPVDSHRTGFVLFQDPQMYKIDRRGPELIRMRDGTPNTLIAVEVGPELAVPWTRPDDITFDPAQPLASLGELPETGFWGGFADGSVVKIRPDIKPETFRGLLTPSGGEVIQIEREVEFR